MRIASLVALGFALGGCSPSSAPSAAASSSATAAPPSTSSGSPTKFAGDSLEVATDKGPFVFHAVHHGTVYVEAGGVVLWIDPYSKGPALDALPKADFVLVTDIHGDHLDEKALGVVRKPTAITFGPKAVAEKLAGTEIIANGEKKKVGPFEVEAIPMYNEKRGPETGKLFHDKGRGNGYVVSYGGRRAYFSGDTECIAEMKALTSIDVAFVCMNLPYTMPPAEAAECVAAFKPKILVPYHFRGSDLGELDAKLVGTGVAIKKLPFY